MIKFEKIDEFDRYFFTSDTHMSQKNIVLGQTTWAIDSQGECRDFDTIEQMDEHLINSINSCVGEDDLLIHNGDVSFGGQQNIGRFFDALRVKNIIWIEGNHDHHMSKWINHPKVFRHGKLLNVNINDQNIVLCHYPLCEWYKMEDGSWNLHGHLHGDENEIMRLIHSKYKSLDVGIDNYYKSYGYYYPYSFEEINNLLQSKITLQRH